MLDPWIIISIIVVIAFIPFTILLSRKAKKTKDESKQVIERLEDETIFDPQTGKSYSYEELQTMFPDANEASEKKNEEETSRKKTTNSVTLPGLIVNEYRRKHLELSFLFLLETFGKQNLINRKVMTPTWECFPFKFEGEEQQVKKLTNLLAKIMEIDPDKINLDFYGTKVKEMGSEFLGEDSDSKNAAGLFMHLNENGKYDIALSYSVLKNPDSLIATIAHEMSHIKLLGEGKIPHNNEELTDITPLIFGLGIFNANASFQFRTNSEGWAYSNIGYLSQMDWSYLLALYAHIRNEENPAWLPFVNSNIQKDTKRAIEFISNNPEKVLLHNNQQNITPTANIAGNWQGALILGNEYQQDAGQEITFDVTINQTGLLINGIAKDTGGIGVNPHPAKILGRFEDNTISFIKQYETAHYQTDHGTTIDESTKGHLIYYYGIYNNNTFSGNWTITDFVDGEQMTVGSGTWTMKQKQ